MMSWSPLNVLEISLNAVENTFGLLFSKVFIQPLYWVSIAFTVIAAIVAMTQRNDISWHCAGIVRAWVRDWYPVIHDQFMPESGRTTTNSAASDEVIESVLPIGSRQRVREIAFLGPIALTGNTSNFRMRLMIAFGFGDDFFTMLTVVIMGLLPICRMVLLIISYSIFSPARGNLSIFSTLFGIESRAMFAPKHSFAGKNSVAIFLPVVSNVLNSFLTMNLVVILSALNAAKLKTIAVIPVLIEELRGRRQICTTSGASLKWERDIKHLKLSFAGFAFGRGQAAKQAFQSGNYADLVHIISIPQGAISAKRT